MNIDHSINKIICGDCFDIMPKIPSYTFDMILCDLPYGTTQNDWDKPLDLEMLWNEYERLIKYNGVIVLTAQSPFDKILACSNLEWFRYEWIWEKTAATGHLNANKAPLKSHENVLVFYRSLPTYNPQKTSGHKPVNSYTKHQDDGSNYGSTKVGITGGGNTDRFPRSVITFPTDKQREHYHPTQKPIALIEYLIRTYTDPGDIILDNCIGSGTTAVAASMLNRSFVGIEKEQKYVDIANKRLEYVQSVLI